MESSNSKGKVIATLLVGAFVGAALGVLFAPDKGSNTRCRLMCGRKNSSCLDDKMDDEAKFAKQEAEAVQQHN